jgi:DNA invertase Pin-like site-specific DNA recombinase
MDGSTKRKGRRTALYLRVSTDAQETRLQRRALLEWLRDNGLTRHDVRWYVDHGHSSAAKSRPAWDELGSDIREGAIERLIVWKLDRLNRWGVKDHLRWRLEVDAMGVEVVSLTEPDAVKFDDIMDVLRESIYAEARRKWLEDHRQRITAGIRRGMKERGGKWGSTLLPVGAKGGPRNTPETYDALLKRHRKGETLTALAKEAGVSISGLAKQFAKRK